MATIKRISSKSGVSRLVDYLTQEEKTDITLTTGIDCNPVTVDIEFDVTKLQYNKTGGITYHHHIQSFKPNEVTPEKAHKIGMEWAKNNFKNHQCLVVTHKDREHVHNHVVVNSVNMETGKKLVSNKNTLKEIKADNDRICARENLSVPEKNTNRYFKQSEIQTAEKGTSWKFQLMNQIDICKKKSKNKKEFIQNMKDSGYKVNWSNRSKYITYTTPENMKCRDKRLPKEYSKEDMENGFREIETNELIKETEKRSGGTGEYTRDTEQSNTGIDKIEPNVENGIGELSIEGVDSTISSIVDEISKSAKQAFRGNSGNNKTDEGQDKGNREQQRNTSQRDRERGR